MLTLVVLCIYSFVVVIVHISKLRQLTFDIGRASICCNFSILLPTRDSLNALLFIFEAFFEFLNITLLLL